jgi:hypothetical protein
MTISRGQGEQEVVQQALHSPTVTMLPAQKCCQPDVKRMCFWREQMAPSYSTCSRGGGGAGTGGMRGRCAVWQHAGLSSHPINHTLPNSSIPAPGQRASCNVQAGNQHAQPSGPPAPAPHLPAGPLLVHHGDGLLEQ